MKNLESETVGDLQTYQITAENWNPSNIPNWTEIDIYATAEAFGIAPGRVIIRTGRVYCDGIEIGREASHG
jgi:hypothetical protein